MAVFIPGDARWDDMVVYRTGGDACLWIVPGAVMPPIVADADAAFQHVFARLATQVRMSRQARFAWLLALRELGLALLLSGLFVGAFALLTWWRS